MVAHHNSTTPPTLELRQELREKVQKYLEDTLENIHRKVGQTARFVCNHPISVSVLADLPGSHLAWVFNGSPLIMDPSRMFYYKGNIDITDVTPLDTGMYECVVKWASGNVQENITVGLYSLVVKATTSTRYVFENEPLKLVCNSESLGRLFPAATRQWLFNETTLAWLPPMLAENGSVEEVPHVRKNQSGVWDCQVTHSRTGRVWDTAWLNLTVDDPPIFIARWYRSMVDHTTIVFTVIGLIVVIFFIIFLFAAYRVKHIEDETDKEFIKQRGGWEDIFSGFVEKGSITIDDFPEPEKNEEEGEDRGIEDKEEEDQTENAANKFADVNSSSRRDSYAHRSRCVRDLLTNTAMVFLKYNPSMSRGRIKPVASYRTMAYASGEQRPYSAFQTSGEEESEIKPLTKETAVKWLLKNSTKTKDLNSLLQEKHLDDAASFQRSVLVSSPSSSNTEVTIEQTAVRADEPGDDFNIHVKKDRQTNKSLMYKFKPRLNPERNQGRLRLLNNSAEKMKTKEVKFKQGIKYQLVPQDFI